MVRRLRRLLLGTTGLTYILVLLGVYTAASGAGLTCGARWPLCNGAVFGLFPADWLSFVEWFHRLVAMVTGFFILGATGLAWWREPSGGEQSGRNIPDRVGSVRVRTALTVAVVLLPAQIVLGGLTVRRYEWVILAAHFVTAMIILTGIALATLWLVSDASSSGRARGGSSTDHRRARRAAAAALLWLAPATVLTPRLVVVFDATAQVAYYAAGLAAYVGLLAVAVWSRGRPRSLATAAATTLFAILVLGRQTYGDTLQVLSLAATLLAVVLTVVATVALYRDERGGEPGPSVPGDD